MAKTEQALNTREFHEDMKKLAAEYDSNLSNKENGSSTKEQSTYQGSESGKGVPARMPGWSDADWALFHEQYAGD